MVYIENNTPAIFICTPVSCICLTGLMMQEIPSWQLRTLSPTSSLMQEDESWCSKIDGWKTVSLPILVPHSYSRNQCLGCSYQSTSLCGFSKGTAPCQHPWDHWALHWVMLVCRCQSWSQHWWPPTWPQSTLSLWTWTRYKQSWSVQPTLLRGFFSLM